MEMIPVEVQIHTDGLVEPILLCPRRVPLDREITAIFINVKHSQWHLGWV